MASNTVDEQRPARDVLCQASEAMEELLLRLDAIDGVASVFMSWDGVCEVQLQTASAVMLLARDAKKVRDQAHDLLMQARKELGGARHD